MSKVQDGAHASLGEPDPGEDAGSLQGQPVEVGHGAGGRGEQHAAAMGLVGGEGADSVPHPLAEGEVGVGTIPQ